jgi:hypothetical protein
LIHNAFEVYYRKDNMGSGQDLSTSDLKDVNLRIFLKMSGFRRFRKDEYLCGLLYD